MIFRNSVQQNGFALALLVSAACTFACPQRLNGLQPATGINADAPEIPANRELDKLITAMVLKHMPHTWERNKGWGAQQARWDGIEWRREGWELKSRRRWKQVNHGTWRKYSARLGEPERHFRVTVSDIRRMPDDSLALEVVFSARIEWFARQAEWVTGVQLYSFSAEGSADIDLSLEIEMDLELVPGKFPPDLRFRPRVVTANLAIADFRIDRVSKLGGEFAQQVTRLARTELDEEVAKKEQELVVRINREIDENADKLRLSLADTLSSRWGRQAADLLPPAIRENAANGKGNRH
jgi:hypothetical protein